MKLRQPLATTKPWNVRLSVTHFEATAHVRLLHLSPVPPFHDAARLSFADVPKMDMAILPCVSKSPNTPLRCKLELD